MKRLTLLRHAKSDWGDKNEADIARRLNDRGRRAAHRIGQWIADEGLRFDRVIASPAVRVRETLARVAEGRGEALEPVFDPRLYLAPPATIVEITRACPDEIGSLLVAGHNPGMQMTVLDLVPEADDPARAAVAARYPTAAIAELLFDADRWADCAPGQARLIRFTRPRDLDA